MTRVPPQLLTRGNDYSFFCVWSYQGRKVVASRLVCVQQNHHFYTVVGHAVNANGTVLISKSLYI